MYDHEPKGWNMRKILLLLSIMCLSIMSLFANDKPVINLNDYPLYVRHGFDSNTIFSIPSDLPQWQHLPPAGPSGRVLSLSDIHTQGVPKKTFLQDWSRLQEEFTYFIPFTVDKEFLNYFTQPLPDGSMPIAGMHLATLGDNWEIFLNGIRVRAELHLDQEGIIQKHRTFRDVSFAFKQDLLKEGQNLLYIRMIGDPHFKSLGMFHAKPYQVGDYQYLQKKDSELLPIILIGLYLFIGIYHISIFLVRKQDNHNIFYALFSIDLAIYFFARTHTIYNIIQNTELIFRIELSSLFLMLPFAGSFLEILGQTRISRLTKGFFIFCGTLVLVTMMAPVKIGFSALRLWQLVSPAAVIYYFTIQIFWRFFGTVIKHYKRYKHSPNPRGFIKVFFHNLGRTPIGNLFIGGTILFATGIFDMIDAFFLNLDIVTTQYGFSIFTMGTAFVLANRFGFLFSQVNDLNHHLERQVSQITETTQKLSLSEQRYRSLFEGSAYPLAILDNNMQFREGNSAAIDIFGLDRPNRERLNLKECLYLDKREGLFPISQLNRLYAQLRAKHEPQEISLRLRTPLGEPKPCRIRLEFLESAMMNEILLTVLPDGNTPLTKAFRAGREVFELESTLIAADLMCRRMTAHISNFIPTEEVNYLMICLREMLINAIEHGNLKIGFADKTRAQKDGTYFDLIQTRQQQSPYSERKVHIDYSVSGEKAVFRIQDEGEGFNHRAYLEKVRAGNPEILEHGRGLYMTLAAFDKVTYNKKGNEVTLVKQFRKTEVF
jgi:PAS domain-containing protein